MAEDKEKDSWLRDASKMFEDGRTERERQRKEFNKTLGNPDLFILDSQNPFGEESGDGYWRCEGGILRVRRPNLKYGFDPDTQEFLKSDWVLKMGKLLEKDPHVFEESD